MSLRMRKTLRIGPIRLYFTQHGYSSWSVKFGAWSWNSRTHRQRVDLPGPFTWTEDRDR